MEFAILESKLPVCTEVPTCFTPARSSVVCSRYASRASVGIAREVLAALLVQGWLILGLRPAGVRRAG